MKGAISMSEIIDFCEYCEKTKGSIDKLCETPEGKYYLLGFIIGILKVRDEEMLIKKLYNSLDDKNKQLVIMYANEQLNNF